MTHPATWLAIGKLLGEADRDTRAACVEAVWYVYRQACGHGMGRQFRRLYFDRFKHPTQEPTP
jgi:hypothetical protein